MNYAITLLILTVCSAAISLVFVRGSIFSRIRTAGPDLWKEFATCPLCVGVWVGAGATVLARFRGILLLDIPLIFLSLGVGCTAGALALLYVRLIDALESAAIACDATAATLEKALKQAKKGDGDP